MVLSFLLLVNVIVNVFFAVCGTPTNGVSRSFGVRSVSSLSNELCLRRCKENATYQEKYKFSAEQCMKHCKQEKAFNVQRKQNGLTQLKVRAQRSTSASPNCHGFKEGQYLQALPTTIKKVDFKEYSPQEHHYNVSWVPVKKHIIEERNYTYYSLLYHFNDDDYKAESKCVLVPKNMSYFVLKHTPKGSHRSGPDVLLAAVIPYPFLISSTPIQLYKSDPSREGIPSFHPTLEKANASSFKIGISISSGVIALSILLIMTIIWRRRQWCRSSYQGEALSENSSEQDNASRGNAFTLIPELQTSQELFHCCYYPESEAFRCHVASIVNRFRSDGFNVIMDSMVSYQISSQGPMRWAETQIRMAEKVLVFLSPGLLRIASGNISDVQSQDVQEMRRVWLELDLLRDHYAKTRSASKMVCVAISEVPVNSLNTPLLWAKVIYKFPEDYDKILQRLNERPSILPFSL